MYNRNQVLPGRLLSSSNMLCAANKAHYYTSSTAANGATIVPDPRRPLILSSPPHVDQWPSSLILLLPTSLPSPLCWPPPVPNPGPPGLPPGLLQQQLHAALALSLSRCSALTGLHFQLKRVSAILQYQ